MSKLGQAFGEATNVAQAPIRLGLQQRQQAFAESQARIKNSLAKRSQGLSERNQSFNQEQALLAPELAEQQAQANFGRQKELLQFQEGLKPQQPSFEEKLRLETDAAIKQNQAKFGGQGNVQGLQVAPEGFRAKGIDVQGRKSFERIPDEQENFGLSPDKQFEAQAIVRDVLGASVLKSDKGFQRTVPNVMKMMADGQSTDQIKDTLRQASYSPELEGDFRDALFQVIPDERKFTFAEDKLGDMLAKKDTIKAKSFLKQEARRTAPNTVAKEVSNKERTVEVLGEVQESLNQLEENGVDTGIFTGTAENIQQSIGRVGNPELRKVANKILTVVKDYRKSNTGVAASQMEEKDFNNMFPNIGKSPAYNLAVIDSLLDKFSGDVDFFYGQQMGEMTYNNLFKSDELSNQQAPQAQSQPSPEESLKAKQLGAVGYDPDLGAFVDAQGNPVQ